MKLSRDTVEILKNFAAINTNLVIQPGKKITTMSATKDILAEFEGPDEFTKKVAIFNLSEFLGAYSGFDNPEIELEDKNLFIKQGKQKVKYCYADENVLISPKKDITMPSTEITIDLTNDLITRMQKMAAVLSVKDFAIIGNGKTVSVKVFDKTAKDSQGGHVGNDFVVDLEVPTTEKFNINFKVEKLRLFPSDYKVEISCKKISKWSSTSIKLVVFIAVESDSVFS